MVSQMFQRLSNDTGISWGDFQMLRGLIRLRSKKAQPPDDGIRKLISCQMKTSGNLYVYHPEDTSRFKSPKDKKAQIIDLKCIDILRIPQDATVEVKIKDANAPGGRYVLIFQRRNSTIRPVKKRRLNDTSCCCPSPADEEVEFITPKYTDMVFKVTSKGVIWFDNVYNGLDVLKIAEAIYKSLVEWNAVQSNPGDEEPTEDIIRINKCSTIFELLDGSEKLLRISRIIKMFPTSMPIPSDQATCDVYDVCRMPIDLHGLGKKQQHGTVICDKDRKTEIVRLVVKGYNVSMKEMERSILRYLLPVFLSNTSYENFLSWKRQRITMNRRVKTSLISVMASSNIPNDVVLDHILPYIHYNSTDMRAYMMEKTTSHVCRT